MKEIKLFDYQEDMKERIEKALRLHRSVICLLYTSNIRLFLSPQWTLEYEWACSRLYKYLWQAILSGKKEENKSFDYESLLKETDKAVSYTHLVITGLVLFGIGALMFIPGSRINSFYFFVLSLFVIGAVYKRQCSSCRI